MYGIPTPVVVVNADFVVTTQVSKQMRSVTGVELGRWSSTARLAEPPGIPRSERIGYDRVQLDRSVASTPSHAMLPWL